MLCMVLFIDKIDIYLFFLFGWIYLLFLFFFGLIKGNWDLEFFIEGICFREMVLVYFGIYQFLLTTVKLFKLCIFCIYDCKVESYEILIFFWLFLKLGNVNSFIFHYLTKISLIHWLSSLKFLFLDFSNNE
jgi:hypothetical protein